MENETVEPPLPDNSDDLIERRSFQDDAKEMMGFLNKRQYGQAVSGELMQDAENFLAKDSPGVKWKDSYEALRMAAFAAQAIAAGEPIRKERNAEIARYNKICTCGHKSRRRTKSGGKMSEETRQAMIEAARKEGIERWKAYQSDCGEARAGDGYNNGFTAGVNAALAQTAELREQLRVAKEALAVIATTPDESMQLAHTMHWDMRGIAREALEKAG